MDEELGTRSEGCAGAGVTVLIIIAALAMLLSLCSCKTQYKVVEVPKVVTQEHTIESVRIDHVRDTLVQRDSIYHYVQGDTVRIERWHTQYRDRWHERIRHDSIYLSRLDTIAVTSPQPLTWWQQTRIHVGDIAKLILVLFIIYRLFICYLKKKVSWL